MTVAGQDLRPPRNTEDGAEGQTPPADARHATGLAAPKRQLCLWVLVQAFGFCGFLVLF